MDDEATPLRDFRKANGLTLKAMAEKIGVSEGQMSRIERVGTHSFPQALKLAEVTSLPVESFRPRSAAA